MPVAIATVACDCSPVGAALTPRPRSANLFKGKPIRFVLGAAPGQDYDVWARFLARHLPRHVPGIPSFIVQNMPGAGHMLATNWLYNIAPRDGTVWGSVSRNIPNAGLQQLPGVRYDPLKFNWLGSPELTNRGCFAMATREGADRRRTCSSMSWSSAAPAPAPP